MRMWKTYWSEIHAVDVDRANETSVFIGGKRKARRSSWETYHETWDAAHDFLLEAARMSHQHAQRNLDRARSALEAVKAMKPPADAKSTGGQ